jgi:hypothetical protein
VIGDFFIGNYIRRPMFGYFKIEFIGGMAHADQATSASIGVPHIPAVIIAGLVKKIAAGREDIDVMWETITPELQNARKIKSGAADDDDVAGVEAKVATVIHCTQNTIGKLFLVRQVTLPEP